VLLLYTDDSILAGPDEKEINEIIKEMQCKKAKLDITIEGKATWRISKELSNIDRKEDGSINLTQPNLIQQSDPRSKTFNLMVRTLNQNQHLLHHPSYFPTLHIKTV
jgi:hypothetical protein